ncbi:MAG: ADP-ribosylation factor-like protein [Candidatus Hermodarchaeota archaeon]|nr:ADP-ribosylation factor-like protein [Candidatus Hermodarchaeota archaeon]
MIHHVFIIDARHDIVVQKKFWVIDVNTIEVEDFATRIKESKSLFIEQIGETKYIGQPLGRGVVILCAESVDEDTTLLEKLEKVTDEFRRVISYQEEYEDFMQKVDQYVTTKLKVSILGYGGVGKTTMVHLLNGGGIPQTYIPTIGIDIQKVEGARIGTYEILCWDFAGQARFRKLWKALFSRSRIVFIVTDSTLENVLQSKDIITFLHENGVGSEIVAIANKQDLKGALQPHLVQRVLGVKTYGLTAIDPENREVALDIIRMSLEKTLDWEKMEFDTIDFTP